MKKWKNMQKLKWGSLPKNDTKCIITESLPASFIKKIKLELIRSNLLVLADDIREFIDNELEKDVEEVKKEIKRKGKI